MGRSISLAIYMLYARYGYGKRAPKQTGLLEFNAATDTKRPTGQLLWITVSSISGAHSMLELVRRMLDQNPTVSCLVTSTTPEAELVFEGLEPARVIFQPLPATKVADIDAFLDHWKPSLAILTEDALLPALIVRTKKRKLPLLFIGAEMPENRYRRWRFLTRMAKSLLRRFDRILTLSEKDARNFLKLGAPTNRLEVCGSLIDGASPLPHDENQRKAMARAIGGRAVWFAASTHPGEEEIVISAHRTARLSYPELLLILSPRNPERGDEIATLARDLGCTVAQRSIGQGIDSRTDIYIADTHGEAGLWHRIAPVSFIGGSLKLFGGHNPFPSAALGSAILHGPEVYNFASAYERLAEANACIRVMDQADLARQLETALIPERAAQLATAAWAASGEADEAVNKVTELLQSYLPNEAT